MHICTSFRDCLPGMHIDCILGSYTWADFCYADMLPACSEYPLLPRQIIWQNVRGIIIWYHCNSYANHVSAGFWLSIKLGGWANRLVYLNMDYNGTIQFSHMPTDRVRSALCSTDCCVPNIEVVQWSGRQEVHKTGTYHNGPRAFGSQICSFHRFWDFPGGSFN